MIAADGSPSSRRAWIEIEWEGYRVVLTFVALLAEGVDRHYLKESELEEKYRSPSSRRAWIEIKLRVFPQIYLCVALLAEGVDRNLCPS